MWNGSIKFPIKGKKEQNNNGFMKEMHSYTEAIPANIKDVTRSEISVGMQAGYHADIAVEIMACNYNKEAFFIDECTGDIYDIKRTFGLNKSMTIEVIAEKRNCGKI